MLNSRINFAYINQNFIVYSNHTEYYIEVGRIQGSHEILSEINHKLC